MAIKPITSVDYVSKNTVNFEGKARKGKNTGSQGYQTSAMKAVPVAVLLAMSPMNQSSAAGEYNRMTVSPRTELVAPQSSRSKIGRLTAVDGDKELILWGVSDDDNPKDAETYLFRFRKKLGDNKIAVLAGQFLAVSNTTAKDDKYLMLYSPIDESGYVNGNYEIAYVPKKLATILYLFGDLPETINNNACGIAKIEEFIETFGEEAVKNAPYIEDCTNFVLDKKF